MHQETTQSAAQPVQQQTPVAPASKTAPIPLDPNLFRHVGGGSTTSPSGPGAGW
jgi:hypothetical protein